MKKIIYILMMVLPLLFTSCHNVNQLYFTGSNLCNDDLCTYENY